MCGFGTVSNLPVMLSLEAERQLNFSKKATELQGTSIRQYYNLLRSPPDSQSNNNIITKSPIIQSPRDLASQPLQPDGAREPSHKHSTLQLASWLHRRGPDVTQIIEIDSIAPVRIEPPGSQLSLVSSVLHLRGLDNEPFPQPVVSSSSQPSSISSVQLNPPIDVYNPTDNTFLMRFGPQNPQNETTNSTTVNCFQYQTHSSSNTMNPFTIPNDSTVSAVTDGNNVGSHGDSNSFYFCWNGEIFAGELDVPVGQSDTSLLFHSLQTAIKTSIHRASQSIKSWASPNDYSDVVVRAVHDVLNMIQGPFAMLLVHQSSLMQTDESPATLERITTIVFCRDKIGRRSLVLQMLPLNEDREIIHPTLSDPTPSFVSNKPPLHRGFILASQPFITNPTDYPSSKQHFTLHNVSWCELPCSGLFSVTYHSPKLLPFQEILHSKQHQIGTLNFLPWNYKLFTSSMSTKIPETMLFPSLHPSLTPVPHPSTLPSGLQSFFVAITRHCPNPLTAQVFFLRLAEAVRRQVVQLPLITHPQPRGQFDILDHLHLHNLSSIYPLSPPPKDIIHPSQIPQTTTTTTTTTPLTEDPLWNHILTTKARICVLFSGGIDCTMVAALAHFYLPEGEPIDLVNVAFVGTQAFKSIDSTAPDRVAAQDSLIQLCTLAPRRLWRLIKVNVTREDLLEHTAIISSLIAPHDTAMDFNIGTILYFGARSQGLLHFPTQQDFDSYNSSLATKSNSSNGTKKGATGNPTSPLTTTRYALDTPSSEKTMEESSRCESQRRCTKKNALSTGDVEITKRVFVEYFPTCSPTTKFTQKYVNSALPRALGTQMKKMIGENLRLRALIVRTEAKLVALNSELNCEGKIDNEMEKNNLEFELSCARQAHSQWVSQHEIELYVSKVLFEGFPINPEDCPVNTPVSGHGDTIMEGKECPLNFTYVSFARVLLLGSGADEQLGGYGRHRTGFKNALRHLMSQSLHQEDVDEIQRREKELTSRADRNEQVHNRGTINNTTPHKQNHLMMPNSTIGSKCDDDDDDGDGAGWLQLIQLDDSDVVAKLHLFQNPLTTNSPPLRIQDLSPSQHFFLQQCVLMIDLKKDVLRIWLRNLGRDDRVIAYWGKESRIAFLDEDLMHFLSHTSLEDVGLPTESHDLTTFHSITKEINLIDPDTPTLSYLTAWETIFGRYITNDFRVPLTTICNLSLPLGVGDKHVLRICAKALGITRVGALQKRAMQFGSKIANRHCSGVVRLSQVNSVLDIVNPQLISLSNNCENE